jgi:hypothetical protein
MRLQSTRDYGLRETFRESIDNARDACDGDESVYTLPQFTDDLTRFGDLKLAPTWSRSAKAT